MSSSSTGFESKALNIFNFSFICDCIHTFCNYFLYIKLKIARLKNTFILTLFLPNKIGLSYSNTVIPLYDLIYTLVPFITLEVVLKPTISLRFDSVPF